MDRTREARLERLATDHSPAIANYLRRRIYPLSPADLDDLVEEVLLVAWRRIDSIPRDAELAWLIGVSRNVLNNARRGQNRRTDFAASWPAPADTASAEAGAVAEMALREALAALSEPDREILLLHYWDGLSAHQLAAVLSISTNAAAVRLSRALTRFKAVYQDGQNA